ncbi:bifunctional 4-hydroxy-2-oxoglutarate aldolase/2-dehydro-3-deoxy-phosphogluconate aldolase [Arthrobacter gandavensis]|uniref:bifunctional 4-hydroxy-2-oxoglutarate aldolase/2-dehydro-3-deoxy-phosphogluconate aldolase n=1 Tax=Arthrobacter gandavensis TaxID=169960 RepID=UPI001E63D692|nr:bifunctional 4-hydroxy-2-oxoglutarate aldolase/2-dehydro-3-deoxy-phosphogluconate aldolase [Arthrobacter gandavensis]
MSAAAAPLADRLQGVVPLATVRDAAAADTIADGLAAGGLPVLEVALRNNYGLAAIERIAARGDLMVGAGTVLTPEQLHRSLDAGASFIVAPGLDEEIVEAALAAGVPVLPGIMTPSDVQRGLRLGLRRMKVFPAGVAGGLRLINAFAPVFPGVGFMPSGGVDAHNLGDYLAHPAVFAVSGSWIASPAQVDAGAEAVAAAARGAMAGQAAAQQGLGA